MAILPMHLHAVDFLGSARLVDSDPPSLGAFLASVETLASLSASLPATTFLRPKKIIILCYRMAGGAASH